MFVTLGQVKFRHWRRHNSAPAQFATFSLKVSPGLEGRDRSCQLDWLA